MDQPRNSLIGTAVILAGLPVYLLTQKQGLGVRD
jgi:hypothetical protein